MSQSKRRRTGKSSAKPPVTSLAKSGAKSSAGDAAAIANSTEQASPSGVSTKPISRKRLGFLIVSLAIMVVISIAWGVPTFWEAKAEKALAVGLYDDAQWYYERLDEWQWRSSAAMLGQARIARHNGDPSRARALLSIAESRGATQQQTALERKLLKIQGGGATALVDELPDMMVRMPQHGAEILEAFAIGFESAGVPERSRRYVNTWIQAAPGDARALLHQAELLATLGELGPAEDFFQQAIDTNPTFAPARLGLARLRLESKRHEEALTLYDEIIAADPSDIDARLLRCACLLDLHREDEAIEGLRAVLAMDDSNFEARHSLATRLAEKGQHEKVVEFIEPLMKDYPDDVSLNDLLGSAYSELGNTALADEHMQRHLDGRARLDELGQLKTQSMNKPPDEKVLLELATGYLKYQWDEAEPWLAKAINELPNSPTVYRAMAEFQAKKGDTRRAEEYSKAADSVSR